MMKRLICTLLAFIMLFGAVGCSPSNVVEDTTDGFDTTTSEPETTEEPEETEAPLEI